MEHALVGSWIVGSWIVGSWIVGSWTGLVPLSSRS
jgi:hypothetical protein